MRRLRSSIRCSSSGILPASSSSSRSVIALYSPSPLPSPRRGEGGTRFSGRVRGTFFWRCFNCLRHGDLLWRRRLWHWIWGLRRLDQRIGENRIAERMLDLTTGIDRLGNLALEIEIGRAIDLLLHLVELGLAHHLVEAALEFACDRPRALHPLPNEAHHPRQVFRTDDD